MDFPATHWRRIEKLYILNLRIHKNEKQFFLFFTSESVKLDYLRIESGWNFQQLETIANREMVQLVTCEESRAGSREGTRHWSYTAVCTCIHRPRSGERKTDCIFSRRVVKPGRVRPLWDKGEGGGKERRGETRGRRQNPVPHVTGSPSGCTPVSNSSPSVPILHYYSMPGELCEKKEEKKIRNPFRNTSLRWEIKQPKDREMRKVRKIQMFCSAYLYLIHLCILWAYIYILIPKCILYSQLNCNLTEMGIYPCINI